MPDAGPDFIVKLARTPADLRAAQSLRYDVFVRELGASGPMVDHENRLEQDRFDPVSDHLLISHVPTGQVVGVYRLLQRAQADRIGQFYSEDEFDLGVLKSSSRRLLELGRSCVHRDFRGGAVMYHLWAGLAQYVQDHDIDILFGVASFHGTRIAELTQPLSLLHHSHLAPPDLRVHALQDSFRAADLVPADKLDRRGAMIQVPALIKAYLRLGGFVGQGAYVDRAFNTTDVCLILDTNRMSARQKAIYTRGRKP